MGKVVHFESADFKKLLDEIRRLWREGSVLILPHARQRMAERGIDELDLQNVIRTGRVTERDIRKRCKVVGQTVEEDVAACVVEIQSNLIVVTVMEVRKKARR